MAKKIIAPAVYSAKKAKMKAFTIHQFMQEKILGQQMQSQKNMQLAEVKKKEMLKLQEKKLKDEKEMADKKEAQKKDELTNSLISSAY